MTTAFRILFRVLTFLFFLLAWCIAIALGTSHKSRNSRRDH